MKVLERMAPDDDLPQTMIERATMLEGVMLAAATNGAPDNAAYEKLRRDFVLRDDLKGLLPQFLRAHRDLTAFRTWTQAQSPHWRDRRAIIAEGFAPLMEHLEGGRDSPGDAVTTNILQTFDAEGVNSVWTKALTRRVSDPEGAITVARTLLEIVCKRILDDLQLPYTDTEDLPKLYGMAAKALNLAPNQHAEEPIKAILGGAMNLVNGLGTLRNRLSDSHGRGGLPVRPSARHASLAVNTAGAIATFLVETHIERGMS
ncbi:abortive infection family protein [Mesorhizobium sp. M0019]|uniref:abortive infection family protein n=1 Tax=Mesorhizobium sp. M0019 TaxID=2956845 RepID=UPI003336B884